VTVELAQQTQKLLLLLCLKYGWLGNQGVEKMHPMNYGKYTFDFGVVHGLGLAFMGLSMEGGGKLQQGFCIGKLMEKQIHFAGDTFGLTMEMKLLAELLLLDYAILPNRWKLHHGR
jgi:hypothetical protein